jgi:hypothetical protein
VIKLFRGVERAASILSNENDDDDDEDIVEKIKNFASLMTPNEIIEQYNSLKRFLNLNAIPVKNKKLDKGYLY